MTLFMLFIDLSESWFNTMPFQLHCVCPSSGCERGWGITYRMYVGNDLEVACYILECRIQTKFLFMELVSSCSREFISSSAKWDSNTLPVELLGFGSKLKSKLGCFIFPQSWLVGIFLASTSASCHWVPWSTKWSSLPHRCISNVQIRYKDCTSLLLTICWFKQSLASSLVSLWLDHSFLYRSYLILLGHCAGL